jgi:hypothetical protein
LDDTPLKNWYLRHEMNAHVRQAVPTEDNESEKESLSLMRAGALGVILRLRREKWSAAIRVLRGRLTHRVIVARVS